MSGRGRAVSCKGSMEGAVLRRRTAPPAQPHAAAAAAASSRLCQVVRGDDDVEAAQLRQLELSLLHARVANLLPSARRVGLARRVDGRLRVRARGVGGWGVSGQVRRGRVRTGGAGARPAHSMQCPRALRPRSSHHHATQSHTTRTHTATAGRQARLELVELDEGGGEATIVGDAGEDDARRIKQPLLKAAVAHSLRARAGVRMWVGVGWVCGWSVSWLVCSDRHGRNTRTHTHSRHAGSAPSHAPTHRPAPPHPPTPAHAPGGWPCGWWR